MAAAYSSVSSDEEETEQFTIITRSPGEVENCIINGYVTADLSAYDVIPDFPNFMAVNNLQVIRMSTSDLQNIPNEDCKIPKQFCKMKYLKKLSLFGDAFRPGFGLLRLPQEFGQLLSLEELNLEHNHFTEFPEQICDLTKLKKLYLNGCEQSSISPRISNLLNLVEADFSNNDFSNGLPTQLFDLPKLKDLYLIECNLSHLPPEIGNLQQLKGIRLKNNLLEDLPSEFFTLKHLTKLNASNNKIRKLSPEVIGLQSLKYLQLKGNNLVCLPDEISKLPYLQVLDVFGNKLTCLPNAITKLDSSTKVVVTGNEYLQKPPLNICTKGMDSIKGYFESMTKAKSIHSNRIKIVMLGESGAGKTCLTKALVYSRATESEDDSTIGVEIYHWRLEPDGLEACVVDCAGQRRYQLTHPFFLSEESLHIVVVNLKKYEIKEESFKENVEDWIKWITARLWRPRIMIVPTHRDECEEIELMSKCEDILRRLKATEQQEIKRIDFEILAQKKEVPSHSNRGHNTELEHLQWLRKYRPIISSTIWSEKLNVSHTSMSVVPVCSKEELHGTIPLQDEIKRVAMVKDLFPSVGRDLPDTWVVLEKAIRQYRADRRPDQVPCMKFNEFAEFANEKAKLTGLCLKSALDYLDSIGEIKFYRNLPETEYSVFLDLPWLCKLVKLLFRHDYDWAIKFQADYFQYDMEEVKFDNQLQELKSGGKLYLGLLRCIWMELGLNDSEFQNMIKALLCFGLACEIPCCSPDCDKALFIPWFLHSNLEAEAREDLFASHPADNEVECRLKFIIIGYLPAGLFDRLCVRTYVVGTDVNTWKDSMLIYLERDTQIFLEVMNDKPEINVIGRCKCSGQEQLWIAVLDIVRELETLLAEWPRLVYNTYTVCPHCVKKKYPKPHNFSCKWMKGKAPSSSRCPNSKFGKHTVEKSCLVPSEESVTDTLLSDLSHKISDVWETVAAHLGLDNDQIAVLKVDHPSNIAERVNAMFQKWKQSKGSQATRKQLCNALKMSERLDLEERVWNTA